MTGNQNKKIIIVLGAGRCGTSLMMQVLKQLGLSMSQNLIPPKAHNTVGPMEDEDIARVYEDLLLKVGSTRVLPIFLDRLPDDLNSRTQLKLRKILKNNLNTSESIWGFKDPYTSFLLPLWYRVFNATNTVPVFILAVRNPAQSTLSRKKHFGILESIGELAWLVNYTEALHHTAADCYIAHYEDWFTRGEDMAEELLEYTGLDPFFQTESVADALKGVIKDNLNRSIYEDYEVQNEYALKLYEILKNCRGRDFDRTGLMQTVKECRAAMNNFRGWYQATQMLIKKNTSSRDVKQLEAELKKMVAENNRLLVEQKDLFDEAEDMRKRVAALNQTLLPKRKNRKNNAQDIFQNHQFLKVRQEMIELKHSSSYRLGQIMINAFKMPGKNTILMPYYLLKLAWDVVSGRGRDELRKTREHKS